MASLGILMVIGLLLDLLSGSSTREDELGAKGDARQRQCPQPVLQQGGGVGRAGSWARGLLTVPDTAGWRVRLRIHPGPETGLERRLSHYVQGSSRR